MMKKEDIWQKLSDNIIYDILIYLISFKSSMTTMAWSIINWSYWCSITGDRRVVWWLRTVVGWFRSIVRWNSIIRGGSVVGRFRCTITWRRGEMVSGFGGRIAWTRRIVTGFWGAVAWLRGIVTWLRRLIGGLTWSSIARRWCVVGRFWWSIWRFGRIVWRFLWRWSIIIVVRNWDGRNWGTVCNNFYRLNILNLAVMNIGSTSMVTSTMKRFWSALHCNRKFRTNIMDIGI